MAPGIPAALALAGLAGALGAVAAPPALELEWPSCVPGSPPLRLPAAAERAQLDAADRQRFHQAAQARYALYQRGGMAPAQVLLMRRGGHWQYAALWQDGPRLCLAAVFAADRFDFTPGWIGRYQPQPADPSD